MGAVEVGYWSKDGHHSFLQPNPILLENGLLRIYGGVRDSKGVSRIHYVECDPKDPSKILNFSKDCVLDIGLPGNFDDNGVVPTIVRMVSKNEIWMYFAGYQIPKNVKFLAFGGLAISKDGGETFTRFQSNPVMDRENGEEFFRVPHSMMFSSDRNIWQVWYGGGNSFIQQEGKSSPSYDIRYCESLDGVVFPPGKIVLTFVDVDETRIGRPFVIKSDNQFEMYFARYTAKETFRLTRAFSTDGIKWERDDSNIFLGEVDSQYDSKMASYPSIYQHENTEYLIYNGNDYGQTGYCWAIRQ